MLMCHLYRNKISLVVGQVQGLEEDEYHVFKVSDIEINNVLLLLNLLFSV